MLVSIRQLKMGATQQLINSNFPVFFKKAMSATSTLPPRYLVKFTKQSIVPVHGEHFPTFYHCSTQPNLLIIGDINGEESFNNFDEKKPKSLVDLALTVLPRGDKKSKEITDELLLRACILNDTLPLSDIEKASNEVMLLSANASVEQSEGGSGLALLEKAFEHSVAMLGENTEETREVKRLVGFAHLSEQSYQQAVDDFTQVLNCEQQLGANRLDLAIALNNLALAQHYLGCTSNALATLEQSVEMLQMNEGLDSDSLAAALCVDLINQALILEVQDDQQEKHKKLSAAQEALSQIPSETAARLIGFIDSLAASKGPVNHLPSKKSAG